MSTELTRQSLTTSYGKWFRTTFVAVGLSEIFFALLTMIQGPSHVMAQFGIPDVVVHSPHYSDAMFWVVLHMCFIGVITTTIGLTVRDAVALRWLPRVFVLFHLLYAYLDIRASDTPLGTGLYKGPASLVTPIISCLFFAAMLHIALRSFRSSGLTPN